MDVDKTGDGRPAPERPQRSGGRPRRGFLASRGMGARAQGKKTSWPLRMPSEPRDAAVFSQTCPIEVRNWRADIRWEGNGKWRRLAPMPGAPVRQQSRCGQLGLASVVQASVCKSASLRRPLANRLSLDAVVGNQHAAAPSGKSDPEVRLTMPAMLSESGWSLSASPWLTEPDRRCPKAGHFLRDIAGIIRAQTRKKKGPSVRPRPVRCEGYEPPEGNSQFGGIGRSPPCASTVYIMIISWSF